MRYFRRADGFTLVELLVVVSILAALVLVAVPRVQGATLSGKQTRVQSDLRTIQDALERHYAEFGHYPPRLGDLVTRGYLKQSEQLFRSPLCNCWYFYAVDNNHNNARPQAYILGAPTKLSAPPHAAGNNDMYRSRPIPQGRDPFSIRARAWLYYPGGHGLILYEPGDITQLASPPANLAAYRTSCQSGAPGPCDLLAN